ncbi:MAG: prepilin peptidase [Patescibacteria group bacterium]
MDVFIGALLFVLGAIIASFIGVVVARLFTGQSILRGRSFCDACGKPLAPLSLVPVLSYLAARGRATCCGARISAAAPLTELLLGVLFVLAYHTLGAVSALPLFLLSLSLLLALVLYDLAHQILPPALLVPFIACAALSGFMRVPTLEEWYGSLMVAFLCALFLASIHYFSRGRAMGFADAPLAFGCALLVGSAALPGFIFSFWIGAIHGIALLARRPRGSRMNVEVPFAPYLAAGFLLAYFTQWNPFIFVVAIP